LHREIGLTTLSLTVFTQRNFVPVKRNNILNGKRPFAFMNPALGGNGDGQRTMFILGSYWKARSGLFIKFH